tara:strand:+ start:1135 stop:1746 length:612 start_codon:yes stop_codon:yes gene_type:complete
MKNLFTLIMVMLVSIGYSQSDDDNDSSVSQSKFYLGVGLGLASTGGDVSSDNNYSTGLNLNFLNIGYRFNETWGLTANLGSAGHAIDDSDAALGIGVFSFGPMISFSVGDNTSWDFKPQYAPSMKGKYVGDDIGIIKNVTFNGSAFIIGNSLVFGDGSKGFDFSLDVDYLTGKFDDISGPGGTIDDDSKYNSFRLGLGIRYNF